MDNATNIKDNVEDQWTILWHDIEMIPESSMDRLMDYLPLLLKCFNKIPIPYKKLISDRYSDMKIKLSEIDYALDLVNYIKFTDRAYLYLFKQCLQQEGWCAEMLEYLIEKGF